MGLESIFSDIRYLLAILDRFSFLWGNINYESE
jgi:hypothetical protein